MNTSMMHKKYTDMFMIKLTTSHGEHPVVCIQPITLIRPILILHSIVTFGLLYLTHYFLGWPKLSRKRGQITIHKKVYLYLLRCRQMDALYPCANGTANFNVC